MENKTEHLKQFLVLSPEGLWLVSSDRQNTTVPITRELRRIRYGRVEKSIPPHYLGDGSAVAITSSFVGLYRPNPWPLLENKAQMQFLLPNEVESDKLGDKIPKWLALFLKPRDALKALRLLERGESDYILWEEQTIETLKAIGESHPVFVVSRLGFPKSWYHQAGINPSSRHVAERRLVEFSPHQLILQEGKRELADEPKVKVAKKAKKRVRAKPPYRPLPEAAAEKRDAVPQPKPAEKLLPITIGSPWPQRSNPNARILTVRKEVMERVKQLKTGDSFFMTFYSNRELNNCANPDEKAMILAGTHQFIVAEKDGERFFALESQYPGKWFGKEARKWDQWFGWRQARFAVRPLLIRPRAKKDTVTDAAG